MATCPVCDERVGPDRTTCSACGARIPRAREAGPGEAPAPLAVAIRAQAAADRRREDAEREPPPEPRRRRGGQAAPIAFALLGILVVAAVAAGLVLLLTDERQARQAAETQAALERAGTPGSRLATSSQLGIWRREQRRQAAERREERMLTRKLGQMVMSGVEGTQPTPALLGAIQRGEIGGIVLFERNGSLGANVRSLVKTLQAAARKGGNPPLLVAIDQEGGRLRRLIDVGPTLPAAQMTDPTVALDEGEKSGAELRRLGIDVSLGPVADVPTSANSFLEQQDRTFGYEAPDVALAAGAFAEGLQTRGVAATAKHFPGVGSLAVTTDDKFSIVDETRAELDRDALPPFETLIQGSYPVELVMVSSAGYKALEPRKISASFSRRIVQGMLRDELGFGGVTITDALDYETSLGRDPAGAALRAARAGCDIVMLSTEPAGRAAYFELVEAAQSGDLSAARIEEATARIAGLKRRLADAAG